MSAELEPRTKCEDEKNARVKNESSEEKRQEMLKGVETEHKEQRKENGQESFNEEATGNKRNEKEKVDGESPEKGRDSMKSHKPKVDLDRILVEEIGQLGRYQLRTILLGILIVQFIGFTTNEFIFTAGRIRTR